MKYPKVRKVQKVKNSFKKVQKGNKRYKKKKNIIEIKMSPKLKYH